ncbi:MAG: radical SAM protein, partial [Desulfobacterales bacterium]|nr:radical SAM protein [Desulfobacterales bacterium]
MTTDYKQSDIHAGLYVHIPFCAQKCPYCDFYSITDLSMTRQFLNALFLEMEIYRHTPLVFDTIYIGGGTPSILDGNDIALILETIHRLFIIYPNPEITMEINPGTVDLNKLKLYKTSGVNRLNIGVQSFNQASLIFLGRIHSSDHAKSVFYQCRNAGFDNIGLDLIYGLPGQTQDSWIR